jgi:prepilin-type N-terminal cleavage/methylation domain-containing protein
MDFGVINQLHAIPHLRDDDAMNTPGLHKTSRRRAGGGFTLVESMMAVVIVSGVLVAALGTFGAIGKARKNQVDRTAACALANELLAEVMQSRFKDPNNSGNSMGLDSGEGETVRSTFDDVDDYDGYTSTPPKTRDGTILSEYTGWTRSVEVKGVLPAQPTTPIPAGGQQVLKYITVRVTTSGGVNVTVRGLRGVDGQYEQLPTSTVNYLTWTGVSAKVGTTGKTVYGAAHPLNLTTSQ